MGLLGSLTISLLSILGLVQNKDNTTIAELVWHISRSSEAAPFSATRSNQWGYEYGLNDSIFVRGVMREYIPYYKEAASSGYFTCLSARGGAVSTRKTIPFSKVNDNFCDCEDGSDEPGTGACSGRVREPDYIGLLGNVANINDEFKILEEAKAACEGGPENLKYCFKRETERQIVEEKAQNLKNVPPSPLNPNLPWRFRCTTSGLAGVDRHILHSRVDDGVCDCCDGSDEFWGAETLDSSLPESVKDGTPVTVESKRSTVVPEGGNLKDPYNNINAASTPRRCPNVCDYLNKLEHVTTMREKERRALGVKAKNELLKRAEKRVITVESELKQQMSELVKVELENADAENKLAAAEMREQQERQVRRQKYEAEKAEWDRSRARENAGAKHAEELERAISILPHHQCVHFVSLGLCVDNEDDETDTGRLECNSVIPSNEHGRCICTAARDVADGVVVPPAARHSRHADFELACDRPEPRSVTCNDVCDSGNNATYLLLLQAEKVESFQGDDGSQFFLPEAQLLRNAASNTRHALEEAQEKLNKLNSTMLALRSEDVEERLLTLLGEEENEYTYSDSNFKYSFKIMREVRQDSFLLGKWAGFKEQTYYAWGGKYDYFTMLYTKGDNTWSGIERETKVLLKCGPENKIISVSEPQIAKYEIEFETPAVCEG